MFTNAVNRDWQLSVNSDIVCSASSSSPLVLQYHWASSYVWCHFVSLMCWVTNKNKLLKVTHLASKIIGIVTPNLSDSVFTLTYHKAHKILNPDHSLYQYFIPLPSVRRYRLPMCSYTSLKYIGHQPLIHHLIRLIFFCFFLYYDMLISKMVCVVLWLCTHLRWKQISSSRTIKGSSLSNSSFFFLISPLVNFSKVFQDLLGVKFMSVHCNVKMWF